MAGIAQQHDGPVRPARKRIALEERPLVHAGAGGQDALHVVVEAGKGLLHLAISPRADHDSTSQSGPARW